GPDLSTVNVDNTEQTLASVVGQRLAETRGFDASAGMTMGDVAALVAGQHERRKVEQLRVQINDIIKHELAMEPRAALKDLAPIDDLLFFVNTTPDDLLSRALNDIRFQGRSETREITFSPKLPTELQNRNLEMGEYAKETDTVVLNLFGQANPSVEYAIHE